MATILSKRNLILDRTVGFRELCYKVGENAPKKHLELCLQAHHHIIELLTPQQRSKLTSKEMKAHVLLYVKLDPAGKVELLKKITGTAQAKAEEKAMPLTELLDKWLSQKKAEGATVSQATLLGYQKKSLEAFFKAHKYATTADISEDMGYKFLEWRSGIRKGKRNKSGNTSASTQKKELNILKRLAKIAYKNGFLKSPDVFGEITVNRIVGVNEKEVPPLDIDTQKKILEYLGGKRPEIHDSVLFLILTGMRVGEMRTLKRDSLKNNIISLHGEATGNSKPTTGKTAAARRSIPVCPTIKNIFERGHIFKAKPRDIQQAIARYEFAKLFPKVHVHRFRHTFATNMIVSQKATLQETGYRMGHADLSTTADKYGTLVPEHYKTGFEETIKERRKWVDFLESDYFNKYPVAQKYIPRARKRAAAVAKPQGKPAETAYDEGFMQA